MSKPRVEFLNIEDLLHGGARAEPQRPLPEAQVAELQHAQRCYATALGGGRWQPGQLVTATSWGVYDEPGVPRVVLEVLHAPLRPQLGQRTSDHSDHSYYPLLDTRIAFMRHNGPQFGWAVVPYWVEGWQFEPYVPAVHDKAVDERRRRMLVAAHSGGMGGGGDH